METQSENIDFIPSNTALLLVEFQKNYTDRGIFHNFIRKQLVSRRVVENVTSLAEHFRKKRATVVHAPLILDKKSPNYKRTPPMARFLRQFTVNTWKAEITDSVFHPDDLVARGRYGFDACLGSNLVSLLTIHGIKNIF